MKHLRLLLFVSLAFFVVSCQRELSFTSDGSSPTGGGSGGGTSGPGTFIDSILVNDQTSGVAEPFRAVYKFNYDAQRRVSSIVRRSSYDGSALPADTVTFSFFYDGSSTLPVRSVMFQDGLFPTTQTTHNTYDASGRLIADSTIFETGFGLDYYNVRRYTYGTNLITSIGYDGEVSTGGRFYEYRDTVRLDSRGCFTSILSYENDLSLPTPNWELVRRSISTFDSRTGPLANLNVAKVQHLQYETDILESLYGPALPVSVQSFLNGNVGTPDISSSASLTYDASGRLTQYLQNGVAPGPTGAPVNLITNSRFWYRTL